MLTSVMGFTYENDTLYKESMVTLLFLSLEQKKHVALYRSRYAYREV